MFAEVKYYYISSRLFVWNEMCAHVLHWLHILTTIQKQYTLNKNFKTNHITETSTFYGKFI